MIVTCPDCKRQRADETTNDGRHHLVDRLCYVDCGLFGASVALIHCTRAQLTAAREDAARLAAVRALLDRWERHPKAPKWARDALTAALTAHAKVTP